MSFEFHKLSFVQPVALGGPASHAAHLARACTHVVAVGCDDRRT